MLGILGNICEGNAQTPDRERLVVAKMAEVSALLHKKDYQNSQGMIAELLKFDTSSSLVRSRLLLLQAAALRGMGKTLDAERSYDAAYQTASSCTNQKALFSPSELQFIQSILQSALQGKIALATVALPSPMIIDTAKGTLIASPDYEQGLAGIVAQAEKLLRDNPRNALALYHRGYARYKSQMYDSAVQDLRRAAEALPPLQAATAYYHGGLCLFALNRRDEAVKAFSQVLALVPSHSESYFYRGCMYTKQEQFLLAIKDFNTALRYNSNDGASAGMLGSLLINAGSRQEGCAKLFRASQLGYTPAIDLIERYCNRTDDNMKIYRLPTVTVEAGNADVNYEKRITNAKRGVLIGQRMNPMMPTLRNMLGRNPLAGFSQLGDGSVVSQAGSSPVASGMMPLQSMINPADCDAIVINTKSFFSIQCIAYFLRQETKPMKNKEIDKITRQLQQTADEVTIIQNTMTNLGVASAMSGENVLDNTFGGNTASLNALYRDFQAYLKTLERKLEEFEVVLKEEGKIAEKVKENAKK